MAKEGNHGKKPTEPGERLDVTRLIAEYGDTKAALRAMCFKCQGLEEENLEGREKFREMKKKLPGDDSLVLEGDDKKAHEAMTALFSEREIKDADGLRVLLEAADKSAERIVAIDREANYDLVCKAGGINKDALKSASGSESLIFEVEGKDDDAKVYVREKEGADKVEFEKYVDENWAALKPSLYDNAETSTNGEQKVGSPFVVQNAGGRPPKDAKPDADSVRTRKLSEGNYGRL